MVQKKKDGEQWLSRAVQRARPEHLRETFTTSIDRVTKLPGQMGEFSNRAAGVLTAQNARTVRFRLAVTAILVSLVAAIVAAVGNYYSLPHTPEETAEHYLSALEKGDYLAGLDRSAYRSFEYTYLPNAVYRAAEGRIESFSLTGTDYTATDRATARAVVTVDGQEQSLYLPLHQVVRTGPYNDLWEFTAPTYRTLSLTSPVALGSITVNNRAVDLPEGRRSQGDAGFSWQLPLLPGDYSFTLPADSYYTLAGSPAVTADLPGTGTDPALLNLEVRPSPRMWAETNSLVEYWLKRCESARRLDAPGCPTSSTHGSESTADITDVQWELIDRPAFYLVQDAARADTWRASRYRPATFELTYLADGKAQRETIDFYIGARVVSNGSHADISVGLGGSEESEADLRQAINSEEAAKSTLQKYAETL